MKGSRRNFLKSTGLAIGGTLILPACYYEPAPFRFFTQAEADCLIAICECIIPADDTPGATEAGVIYYIDKQIVGPFKKYQKTYRDGLAALQKDCLFTQHERFEILSPERQVKFLEMIEENHADLQTWDSLIPSAFFNLVINHTMQGFYGAPRHGGNRNYVSYRILGLGYPQIVGQNRYGKGDSNG
jgi:gluconate 2-dehydrogenase gamma chain